MFPQMSEVEFTYTRRKKGKQIMAYMFFNMCRVKYNYILQHKYVLK